MSDRRVQVRLLLPDGKLVEVSLAAVPRTGDLVTHEGVRRHVAYVEYETNDAERGPVIYLRD